MTLKYPFGQRSDLSHIHLIYPSSSWEGTVSSTVPSSIDLVTPKINQPCPSKPQNDTGGLLASPQSPQRRCPPTASAIMHSRHPVRFVGANLCQGQQYERALHPYAARFVARARRARPIRSHNQPVEEEVRGCEAEDKQFILGAGRECQVAPPPPSQRCHSAPSPWARTSALSSPPPTQAQCHRWASTSSRTPTKAA
ncbi:hypothetical protein EDB85DRAFT_325562 [Lactarius pseudohatsudake]|nr:hypothetical protein EDB85DRAFT_325562 [Lactarius pseudohatsudake]